MSCDPRTSWSGQGRIGPQALAHSMSSLGNNSSRVYPWLLNLLLRCRCFIAFIAVAWCWQQQHRRPCCGEARLVLAATALKILPACPWVRRTQTPSAARRRRDGRTCLVYHKPATKHVGGKFVQCTHYMIHTQNTAICKHLNEILVYCTVIAGLQSSNLHISNTSPSVKAQAPPSYQGRRVWFTVLDGVGEPVKCELTRFFP